MHGNLCLAFSARWPCATVIFLFVGAVLAEALQLAKGAHPEPQG